MNDFNNSPNTGFDSTLVLVSYIVSLFTAVVGPRSAYNLGAEKR